MSDNRNFVNKFANQGGGDIYVEDAKLSEISAKTAIASEGVMLKGTDGAYYEIDKASLSEIIRAELGAILADNSHDNGTSVAKVPTLNSTDNVLGSSSIANLASVLGGLYDIGMVMANDANTIVSSCSGRAYFETSSAASAKNYPSKSGSFVFMCVNSNEFVYQECLYDDSIYTRKSADSGSSWTAWKGYFGASDLSSLASLLGDKGLMRGELSAGDINYCEYGVYNLRPEDAGSSLVHCPSSYNGTLLAFRPLGNFYTVQIYIASDNEKTLYYRLKTSDWYEWRRIQSVAV